MLNLCVILVQLNVGLSLLAARSADVTWMLLAFGAAPPARVPAPSDPDLTALGLDRMPSSRKELRRAYRHATKAAHPDAGGSADAFLAVTEAFRSLTARGGWMV